MPSIIPPQPTVNFEYSFECTAPSKEDTCDGKLLIRAWLKVTGRIQLDSSHTWLIERRIMPQQWIMTYELDADLRNEIDYCESPKIKQEFKGDANTQVNSHMFNHRTPIILAPDPPNDDGSSLVGETTFRWSSTMLALSSLEAGASLDVTALAAGSAKLKGTAGIGSTNYEFTVPWILDIDRKVDAGNREDRAVILDVSDQDDNVYCDVHSESGDLAQSTGGKMWPSNANPSIVSDTLDKAKR